MKARPPVCEALLPTTRMPARKQGKKSRTTNIGLSQFELENLAFANALQLEAARRCTVPIRFNFAAHVILKSLPSFSVFTADTLRYAVTLTFDL